MTRTVCIIKSDAHGVENKINRKSEKLVTNTSTVFIAKSDTCRLLLFVELHHQPDCAELARFIGCLCIDILT